ncbi:MAG: PPE domain-containing protein [Lachnospiraceae bacterium]|nr:PPE domain-containing protein [Lachnospiraceae bacterium]
MSSIEFDFELANKQAEQLDALAAELGKLSTKSFDSTLQSLSSNWKGDSATAYLNKGAALQTRMNTTVKNMGTVAGSIRTIAKIIYEAELAAKREAEENSYRG